MPRAHQGLTVRIWDDYASGANLMLDASDAWNELTFSTAIHGGFRRCTLGAPMRFEEAWKALERGARGWHFYHVEITEGNFCVWEGRIIKAGVRWGESRAELLIEAQGYWGSMRDQLYSEASPSSTSDQIIKDMINDACPDINTDFENIDSTTGDSSGVDLDTPRYPQDIIIDSLVELGDADGDVWHFAVWDQRKAHWYERVEGTLHWRTTLADTASGEVMQDARELRNVVTVVSGGNESTVTNQESIDRYVRREIRQSVSNGLPTARREDAGELLVDERKDPHQQAEVVISGRVYGGRISPGYGTGQSLFVERPKWWIRSGEVIRIEDIVPQALESVSLDNQRTFLMMETIYDAARDRLTATLDRPLQTLDAILMRSIAIERDTQGPTSG